MKTKYTLFFLMISFYLNAQVVIGSAIESPAAALKLDASDKALKVPLLSIQDKNDTALPVANPARSLFFYNLNNNPTNDIYETPTYWGEFGEYQFFANKKSVNDAMEKTGVPLLLFSAILQTRPTEPCGAGTCTGWQWTKLNPTADEINYDKFSSWNTQTHEFIVPEAGNYSVGFDIAISSSSNGNGTLSLRVLKNGTVITPVNGRYISITNRAYSVGSYVYNLAAGDKLSFTYTFTQNNYRLERGTVSVLKY